MSSTSAYQIFKLMYDNDPFSKWMGIELVHIREGYCCLRMRILPSMLNGFKIAHGGIAYSLSDSALAFAANSYGIKCVSVETSISHVLPVKENDLITAEAKEVYKGNRTAVYDVDIKNEKNEVVAVFRGTVYRTGKTWIE
ncbi:MAG: hotdog fold thioesterase [Bacteroidia bacterium]|nr:hotdog fold thioesterase [Bacteroidia bacterium]MCZ2276632.1 hotdog fold thioesterase [Bacteroidia bacterium]